jgi:NAD(P)-dependent dehydrogenase (short-subunit alcohol dehydrogenase family)
MGAPLLAGRKIVITGAARGVGLAVAQACAAQGAELILVDRLATEGEAATRSIAETGARARFVAADLADPTSIEQLGQNIRAREGSIDGLVNNAALATEVGGAGFEDIDLDLWDRIMRVNVRGTWLVTRALAPMLRDGSGRIVNMASDTALWGPPRLMAYAASKGAVISMTRCLSRELGPRKIGVVALAPGIKKTAATDYVPQARHDEYESRRSVTGPQFPEDIVDIVAFALSDGALALTGQTLPTNAGFWLN